MRAQSGEYLAYQIGEVAPTIDAGRRHAAGAFVSRIGDMRRDDDLDAPGKCSKCGLNAWNGRVCLSCGALVTLYRVHESSLCHQSIKGSDMIAMVRADDPLVQAAPDLLAALKATMDTWGSNAPHDFDVCEDQNCGCVQQQARAAIAKAEGR